MNAPQHKDFRRIGVWQTAFLGDLVLTLPLLHTLRRAFPAARVEVFTRRGLAPVLAGHPEFAVREFDKRGQARSPWAAWSLGRSLGREGFDVWVSAHTSLRSALVAAGAAGIPIRVGYDRPWWNRLAYTATVARSFGHGHEIERLLRLAEPLGVTEFVTEPGLRPAPDALSAVEAVWAAKGLDDAPVLGLHPGSMWPTKRWPARHFAAILDRAVEAGARVLVFAGPGEEAIAAEMLALARHGRGPRVTDLSGKLDIPALLAHIHKLSAYVANDSGPMHLAWATGTPVVALFGPTVERFGFFPRGPGSAVAQVALPCRPCRVHGSARCPLGHHRCMLDLTPDTVWPLVARALETPHAC